MGSGVLSEPLRVAPGVVSTETAPTVVGVRPFVHGGRPVAGVWEALIDDHDGRTPKAIFTQGPRVIRFLERYCTFTQARWAGKPMALLPWQKALLVEAFELRFNAETGRFERRYHEILVGTPKKNGKSELVGGLAHYFLIADGEPSPIVIAAAANETSANLLFRPAKSMVTLSSGARERGALEELCEAEADSIFLRGVQGAELRRVPASPKATEGLNIFVNLMDEWHEWTTPAAMQTATKLMNGTVLRPRYMNWRTTTAGFDPESLLGQDYEWGRAVASGDVEAPEWFFRWYESPEAVERAGKIVPVAWDSEEAVRLANPSYGELAAWEFYANKLRNPRESEYRRYFLNQWTSGEESWLPSGMWEAGHVPGLELDPSVATAVGIDASYRNDATAVVWVQRREGPHPETGEPMEMIDVAARIWERPLDPNTRKPRAEWIVPKREVGEHLRWLATTYRVTNMDYDPAYFHDLAMELAEEGLPMREFSQSNLRKMVEACQATYQTVLRRGMRHGDEAKLSQHVNQAVAVQVATGSAAWVLRKGKAKRKMDGAVALVMAVWGLLHPEPEPESKLVDLHMEFV